MLRQRGHRGYGDVEFFTTKPSYHNLGRSLHVYEDHVAVQSLMKQLYQELENGTYHSCLTCFDLRKLAIISEFDSRSVRLRPAIYCLISSRRVIYPTAYR